MFTETGMWPVDHWFKINWENLCDVNPSWPTSRNAHYLQFSSLLPLWVHYYVWIWSPSELKQLKQILALHGGILWIKSSSWFGSAARIKQGEERRGEERKLSSCSVLNTTLFSFQHGHIWNNTQSSWRGHVCHIFHVVCVRAVSHSTPTLVNSFL